MYDKVLVERDHGSAACSVDQQARIPGNILIAGDHPYRHVPLIEQGPADNISCRKSVLFIIVEGYGPSPHEDIPSRDLVSVFKVPDTGQA